MRYLIAHPDFLRHVRDGADVYFLPPGAKPPPRSQRPGGKVQYFIKGPDYYKPA